jgi:branched-chain amino acid transport system ATP-binding protein
MEILEFLRFASLKDELAGNLPYGHQRALGICIALATEPELLLLDEPATGMNPTETSVLVGLIRKIRDRGTTVVVVEHDMRTIMSLCDRLVVFNYGRKIAEGLPEQIKRNKEVVKAYLGGGQ